MTNLGFILLFTKNSFMTTSVAAGRIGAVQVNEPRADSGGIGVKGLFKGKFLR